MATTTSTTLVDLPAELLLLIVRRLPVRTQAMMAQVCRRFRDVLHDSSLVDLHVARFHQRLALCRPVEPELLPYVKLVNLADMNRAVPLFQQFAQLPACQLSAVTFQVPVRTAWTPALEALSRVRTLRSLKFVSCRLEEWDCSGLRLLQQVEHLVRVSCAPAVPRTQR